MRKHLFLPSLILCAVLLYMPTSGNSEAANGKNPASIPDSQSQIIKLTDSGIEPETLTMNTQDGVLFFLNQTKQSLVTLSVKSNGVKTHCASNNMQIGDDGFIRSKSPIVPQDFASTCFHKPGTYEFTVYGLKDDPEGVRGTIIVR
jgi:hypothetical protein